MRVAKGLLAAMTKMNTPPETPPFGSPEWEQQLREEVRRRGHRNIERDTHRIERELLRSAAPSWQRWAVRAFFFCSFW